MSPSRRAWIFRALALGLGLLLAAGLVELALTLRGFSFQLHPTVVQFGYPDPQQLEIAFDADPDLLWVHKHYPDQLEHARAHPPDLVLMGDSCTVMGSYPQQLERLLDRHHPGHSVELANLAVIGWSSYQGLRQLERDVLPLEPEVVTLYYGWNDHWMTMSMQDANIGRLNRYYPRLLHRIDRLRLVQGLHWMAYRAFARNRERGTEKRVPIDDFEDNLEAMVRLARRHDITPVLITAPTSARPGELEPHRTLVMRHLPQLERFRPLHDAYVERVRAVAAREGASLLDLAAAIDALPTEQAGTAFLQDRIHLSEPGSQRVGQLLYEHLKAEGLLDDRLPPASLQAP
jgi:lysophospholipase L1-like esterase